MRVVRSERWSRRRSQPVSPSVCAGVLVVGLGCRVASAAFTFAQRIVIEGQRAQPLSRRRKCGRTLGSGTAVEGERRGGLCGAVRYHRRY
jgi:hypothetical protein